MLIVIDTILVVLIVLAIVLWVQMELSESEPWSDRCLRWVSYVLVMLTTWIVIS